MRLRETARLSVESLLAQKLRTALTVLGMVIGVGAVVLLVSLGQGAKNYVLREFEGLGTNLIVIQPGKSDKKTHFGPPVGAAQRKMTTADVGAIERKALNVKAVSGLILGLYRLATRTLSVILQFLARMSSFLRSYQS